MLRVASRLFPTPTLQRQTAAAARLRSSQPLRNPYVNIDAAINGAIDRAKVDIQESLGAEQKSSGLTRNPNMNIMGSAVANSLADRRLGDPALFGPRTSEWWTGKAPQAAPGPS